MSFLYLDWLSLCLNMSSHTQHTRMSLKDMLRNLSALPFSSTYNPSAYSATFPFNTPLLQLASFRNWVSLYNFFVTKHLFIFLLTQYSFFDCSIQLSGLEESSEPKEKWRLSPISWVKYSVSLSHQIVLVNLKWLLWFLSGQFKPHSIKGTILYSLSKLWEWCL